VSNALGFSETATLELVRLLVDFAVKGSVLIALVWGASLFLRRASASLRNLLWTAALIALITLPVFPPLIPSFELGLVPEFAPPPPLGSVDQPAADVSGRRTLEAENSGLSGPKGVRAIGPPWATWITAVWLLGGVLAMAWIGFGKIGLILIERKSLLLGDDDRTGLMDGLRRHLNLRRSVQLYSNPALTVAINRGLLRPRIILPSGAASWKPERLRVVFLHELAHIKRLDGLVDLILNAALVVFWYHPLVWLVARRLRAERERACDDAVLTAGIKASIYASHLMDVASELGSRSKPLWQVVTISQGSSLKDRLLCILDPKLRREAAPLRCTAPFVLLVAGLLIPIASVRIWDAPSRPAIVPPGPAPNGALPREAPSSQGGSSVSDDDASANLSWRIRTLVDLLRHEDTGMRLTAVRSIAGLPAGIRLEPLLSAMTNEVTDVRKIALAGLAGIDEPRARQALENALEDASSEIRVEAAKAITGLEPRVFLPLLIKAMGNEVAQVRRIAIRKLIESDDPRARETIRGALSDKDEIVRRAAAAYFKTERTRANAG
jgi:beta-lactamase regulating signal transducer with metallopeptidase domain